MNIIHIENEGVIYMGVSYNKKQWEIKLKEINLKKYDKQRDKR